MSKLRPVLQNMSLPVIGSPLFIISNPKLVIEQCKAGVVGSMPALNARPAELLDEWLAEITETLAAYNKANPDKPAAPFFKAGRLLSAFGSNSALKRTRILRAAYLGRWASSACAVSATSYHSCSAAPLPWPSGFSWAAPFFKAGRSLLAFGSNCSSQPTAYGGG